jgi:hypothetical protein
MAILLGGCTTVQEGPSGSRVAHRPPPPELPKETVTPQPRAAASEYKGKESFAATEVVEQTHSEVPVPPGAQSVTLRMGEMREVYRQTWRPGETQYAFFLPEEATNIVKLVVETDGFTKTYFLRAIGYGDSVGGVIKSEWLAPDGFHPRDVADFARIQEAVRQKPVFISVKE